MDINQSLFDIIGIFIGFICIILLLSIVVTSMVQAIQAAFRVRARNLKRGIQALIDNLFAKGSRESNALAIKALNAKNICFLGRNDVAVRLSVPPISYIDPKDLPAALVEAGLNEAKGREEEITGSFNKLWNQMENRFLFIIRNITFVCAILVAGYFQVSTPSLLEKLSTDRILRHHLEEVAKGIEKPVLFMTNGEVSEKALAALKDEFPAVKKKIEEAGGIERENVDIVAELQTILADIGKENAKIINRYNELRDGIDTEQKEAAVKQAEAVTGALAKINIKGWPEQWEFYFKDGAVQWRNLIGVLITAVFLSLGAPFWFKMLREALRLKDLLSTGVKRLSEQEQKQQTR